MRMYVLAVALAWSLTGRGPVVNAKGVEWQAPSSEGLESLSHGLYYHSVQGWKRLGPVRESGIRTKHGASVFAGVPPGAVYEYAGADAPDQFEDRRPEFGVRLDPSRPEIPGFNVRDLLIVRLAKQKNHRELQIMRGGFASARTGLAAKDVIDMTLTSVADRTYRLVPKEDLKLGEYLITFRGTNGTSGYDFGIK